MTWVTIVDATGGYRGIVPVDRVPSDCQVVPSAPPSADHKWTNGAWLSPVPLTVTDQQLAAEMKARGLITQAERLALVGSGALPPNMVAALGSIEDQDLRDDIEAALAGMTVFDRSAPAVIDLFAAMGIDLDDFFRSASAR